MSDACEWSVLVASRAPEGDSDRVAADDARVDRLIDELSRWSPSVVYGGPEWSVILTVEAASGNRAVDDAVEIVDKAAAEVGLPDWPHHRFQAVVVADQELEETDSNFPDIVGAAETLEILGITRQRLHELRGSGRFPRPIVDLAATPIWLRSTIVAFVDRWDRRPGRRSKVQDMLAANDELDAELQGIVAPDLQGFRAIPGE